MVNERGGLEEGAAGVEEGLGDALREDALLEGARAGVEGGAMAGVSWRRR